MAWGHTNCSAMDGWQSRLQSKVLAAGVAGSFAGAILSVLQQKHLFRHSIGTAASCMICIGGFAVCQETSRLLRCEDSAANSIVAGAATGALLLGLQRTQQQPMIQDSERFPQPSDARPSEGTWAGAFGIKHLSDAEWEEHERERQAKFDQRLAKAGLGPDERMVQHRGRSES